MRWILWVVGGKPSLFEGCLVILYSTVLYKERKEIEVVYNYNYRLYSKSIYPELPTPLSHTKKKTETYFFDKRSRLISNCEKKNQSLSTLSYLFVYKLTLL